MCNPLDNSDTATPNIKQQIYKDIAQPSTKQAGKFLERIPRAINAAFSPIDIWIAKREYNVAATKKALESKLSQVDPDQIIPPEPYIAVPAVQSISHCINNQVLFDLYANLLAKAMVSNTKENVHPSFVEIIKQMSPNDALVLKEVARKKSFIPAARFSIVMASKGMHLADSPSEEHMSLDILVDIHLDSLTETQIRISIDNLKRLGLITFDNIALYKNSAYEFTKHSELYASMNDEFNKLNALEHTADYIRTYQMCLSLSPIGKSFCNICIEGFN